MLSLLAFRMSYLMGLQVPRKNVKFVDRISQYFLFYFIFFEQRFVSRKISFEKKTKRIKKHTNRCNSVKRMPNFAKRNCFGVKSRREKAACFVYDMVEDGRRVLSKVIYSTK